MKLGFKSWLEAFDLQNQSLDNVSLDNVEDDSFDEESERQKCERNADISMSDVYSDYSVYDEPSDDPDFRGIESWQWHADNPRPDRESYNDEEAYQEDLETWKSEYEEVEEKYQQHVDKWEREQSKRRSDAEDAYYEKLEQEVEKCLEEKRQEHRDDNPPTLTRKFNVDNVDYTVNFSEYKVNVRPFESVSDVWSIEFKGPLDHALTGEAKNPVKIYTQLLLTIKHLIASRPVNGLHFVPADPAMALVYRRFFKQFLSKDFIPVDTDVFLTKSIVRQQMDFENKHKALGWSYNNIANKLRMARSDIRQTANDIRQQKATNRSKVSELQGWVGKLFMISNATGTATRLALGIGVNRVYGTLTILALRDGSINTFNIDSEQLKTAKIMTPAEVESNYPDLWSMLKYKINAEYPHYSNHPAIQVVPAASPPAPVSQPS